MIRSNTVESTATCEAPVEEAKRLLIAIQKCAAWAKSHSRHSMHQFLTRHAASEHRRELAEKLDDPAWLKEAVTVHDIEHFANKWKGLVPASPTTRAAIAHMLSDQYIFAHAYIPNTRSALGLGDSNVREGYRLLYGNSLDEIYTRNVPPLERFRAVMHLLSALLESVPPFWMAFALTLPVGPGLLALPIAIAEIGPLPGVALLLLFGGINIVTVAALAEALARSSKLRYSRTFFLGHLVEEYLGKAGSVIFTMIFVIDLLLVLLIFYLGVAGTLADATGLPPPIWGVLLFLIGLFFLSRKSLNTTLGFTMIVGVINVGLILLLTLLAFTRLQTVNLLYMNLPFLNGRPFDPVTVRLIFGVLLATYFSHMLVGNYGRLVLQHDPSGKALVQGSIASIAFTTLLSVLWVLAMNGALDPTRLGKETGTVLIPLSSIVGASVRAVGSIFVVIGLGMASIHISLGLFFTVREWLSSGALHRLIPRGPLDSLLPMLPVALTFLIAEWMLITGTGSFSELFGFVGVIALSLLAAIYPMLLLVAARRKGELVPAAGVYSFFGNPLLIGGIYVFFVAGIFVHGLVLWDNPIPRLGALAIGAAILATTALMVRHRAFTTRLVLEIHEHISEYPSGLESHVPPSDRRGQIGMTVQGHLQCAAVTLAYQDREENAYFKSGDYIDLNRVDSARFSFQLPDAKELKVAARRISHDGELESLPVHLTFIQGDETREIDLEDRGGETILPLGVGKLELNLALKPGR